MTSVQINLSLNKVLSRDLGLLQPIYNTLQYMFISLLSFALLFFSPVTGRANLNGLALLLLPW